MRWLALLFVVALSCHERRPDPPAPTAQAAPPPPNRQRSATRQALGSRRSPFAHYITAIHHQLHKPWTLGFLGDLDGKPSTDSPYADPTLWTQLAIVVNGDGSLDHVTIVRSSGVPGFDAAAIDVVKSVAPYPPPPELIKSDDGRVYLDWQFHRDSVRGCGTFGVDPYILTSAGQPFEHDTRETGAPSPARSQP
jgi:TonB family protein